MKTLIKVLVMGTAPALIVGGKSTVSYGVRPMEEPTSQPSTAPSTQPSPQPAPMPPSQPPMEIAGMRG